MKIAITNNISWQIYEDTVYILDERTEHMYRFDGPGYFFWKTLLEINDVDLIIQKLAELYNVQYDILSADLLNFIYELCDQGIVEEIIHDY